MKANATVFVPMRPGEHIAHVNYMVPDGVLGEATSVRKGKVSHAKDSLVSCEAQDVYEVKTTGGRVMYGIVTAAGKFERLDDEHAANRAVLEDM